MAAGDQTSNPPKSGIPLWFIIGGGVIVAFILYRKYNSGTATSTSPVQGVTTVDPATGLPIDPVTGQPYYPGTNAGVQSESLGQWISSAEQALVGAGISPALASRAVYDYSNSQPLDTQEANAINKALGLVGFPPVALPFLGTVVTHTTGGTQKPPPVPTKGAGAKKLLPIASPPHVNMLPGERIVDVIRDAAAGTSAGYYLTNFGGVYAVGGAPFRGSAFSLKGYNPRNFTDIILNSNGGYTLYNATGQKFSYNPVTTKKAA